MHADRQACSGMIFGPPCEYILPAMLPDETQIASGCTQALARSVVNAGPAGRALAIGSTLAVGQPVNQRRARGRRSAAGDALAGSHALGQRCARAVASTPSTRATSTTSAHISSGTRTPRPPCSARQRASRARVWASRANTNTQPRRFVPRPGAWRGYALTIEPLADLGQRDPSRCSRKMWRTISQCLSIFQADTRREVIL